MMKQCLKSMLNANFNQQSFSQAMRMAYQDSFNYTSQPNCEIQVSLP